MGHRRRVRLHSRKRVMLEDGHRRRARLGWFPAWGPEYHGYTYKRIIEVLGKVDRTLYDFEDLLSEAQFVFFHCAETYPRVTDAPHFMSLYKTALRNYFTDMVREQNLKREAIVALDSDVSECENLLPPQWNNAGPLLSELHSMYSASSELRAALEVMGTDEFFDDWQCDINSPDHPNGRRETLNQRLRRIVGFDKGVNVIKELRSLLQGVPFSTTTFQKGRQEQ